MNKTVWVGAQNWEMRAAEKRVVRKTKRPRPEESEGGHEQTAEKNSSRKTKALGRGMGD